MKGTLLDFNLLKTELIFLRIEIIEARSTPLLVFLGVILLKANDVLGHLLEHLSLEGALGLAGAQLRLESILVCLRRVETTVEAIVIEFSLLGGGWGFESIMSVGGVREDSFLGLIQNAPRHDC
jgi:hypothetical protein